MIWLILGLVLFLGIHCISIVAPDTRAALAARLGESRWKLLYTAIAVLGFVLIVVGYGQARTAPTVLYTPPTALRHVALLLLVPVFPLLIAAYLKGRIKLAVKHPMLGATKLWAFAHLLANGNLADVLLFGGFFAWAMADVVSLKRRGVGPVPYAPKLSHDLVAVLGGLLLYAATLWFLHAWLIGVAPIALPSRG